MAHRKESAPAPSRISAGAHPLLLGHRGARGVRSIPENTIASFDRCLADGCDGFEFDVRLTADGEADGEAVVCHDAKVGKVDIARANAATLPTLPRLYDVLARYREAFLDIELKVPGLEKIITEVLKDCLPQRFVVSSFLPEVLTSLHRMDAEIPLGLICETKAQLRRWKDVSVGYVIPHFTLANQDLIDELRASGKKTLVWTVNAAASMRRFASWGVDGIISDDPRKLKATLG